MRFDVAIVGAGIAGASLAAEVAPHASVVLIEAEERPGMHATGRSAAFWSETYGGPRVSQLTAASYDLLAHPEPSFAERAFLKPRGELHLGRAEHAPLLDRLAADHAGSVALAPVSGPALDGHVPGLRPEWDRGLWEAGCADIDVAALHEAYLRAARRSGAQLLTAAPVRSAERGHAGWRVSCGGEDISCTALVNAAGAWADVLAALAGARPLGIRPYRRTVAQLRVDPPTPATLPLVMAADESFYFKGEGEGRIWLSPHDETPCAAGDVAAEELDLAVAIGRLEAVVDWRVVRVERAWAGLRSFAPDRLPVYGWDREVPGAFWCAGQGGFGIQTAPAAAKLAAALLLGRAPDEAVADVDPAAYRADRF